MPDGTTLLAERLRAAFEQTPVSTVVYDASGRPLAVNPAFERLWGAALSDVPAEYSVLADPQLEAAGVLPLIRRAFAGDAVTLPALRYEMASTVGRGRVLWTQAHLYPVRGASGAVEQVVLTHEDVTARHEAEEALAEAAATARRQQALSAALAVASTVADVAAAVVEHATAVLGATGIVIARLTERGDEIEIVRAGAMPDDVRDTWRRFPIGAPVPIADVARTGIPVFLESRDDWATRYPDLAPTLEALGQHANAVMPLVADGRVLGVLGAAYDAPQRFDHDARARAGAVALQCAQALERARLFEAERAARAEAEAERERLNTVLAQLPVGVVIVEAPSGRITAANEAVERIWGQRPATASVERYSNEWTGFHADGRRLASEEWPLARALRGGERVIGETVEIERPDGGRALLDVSAEPVRDATGRVTAAVAVLVDVTARVRARREMERLLHESERARADAEAARGAAHAANQAKAQFLAVMSHELRTPLNAIGGYAELLELGIRGPVTREQLEDLRRIQQSQRHLLGLINDVLNYARIEAGAVHYDVAAVHVAEALAAAEALVMPQASAKGLTLVTTGCPRDELLVHADAEKLRQVLINLLSNAVKFTDRGGRVELDCDATDDVVRVRVRDTGVGIPADKQRSIFEPFVQVRADLTRTAEGTGLGLAISRDLARGMGGDLTVASAVGEGSTFTLTLPRAWSVERGA
ncbi:PAS sensor protein (plasmid) [Gemmatirosa kalamazoonensis]|uniref:histidine kinase n=1 Tax=Gemmatirosa kalamazoonensis TaxID=861299 RepID=W0RRR7_9BACT|nr:ATP-binding protein [Gemmatirosa kalamazoonensis]AHG93157.1 PAS sensor protein [Gemmatirosa kalamazoonensis]